MSVEQIRESELFREVLWVVNSVPCEFQPREILPDIEYGLLHEQLWSFDIQDLRLLKSSINNQICLHIFQDFLFNRSEIGEHELFSSDYNIETKQRKMIGMTFDDFFKCNDTLSQQLFYNLYNEETTKIDICISIMKRDMLRIIHKTPSKKLIHFLSPQKVLKIRKLYINLFSELIKKTFDFYVSNNILKLEIQDIVRVYQYLEYYIQKFWLNKNNSHTFASPTNILIPNTNTVYFRELIDKGYTSEKIQQILKDNNIKQIDISINDRETTHLQKEWNQYFDESSNSFKIKNYNTIDPLSPLNLEIFDQYLWGCPFAKSTIEWKNAFKLMFKIFDNYMLDILKKLEARWL